MEDEKVVEIHISYILFHIVLPTIMVTGFDILSHDRRLRRHWLYRSAAFIFDGVIVFFPLTILLWLFDMTDVLVIGLISSLVFYLSSTLMEISLTATPGKYLFGLRVHTLVSDKQVGRIFLRNVDRLFWFALPPIDFALGMATIGDPRQRLLDRIANTTVVIESERKWHEAHLEEFTEPVSETEEEEPEIHEESQASAPSPGNEEKCRACGGRMIMLADRKLQCRECGLIQ